LYFRKSVSLDKFTAGPFLPAFLVVCALAIWWVVQRKQKEAHGPVELVGQRFGYFLVYILFALVFCGFGLAGILGRIDNSSRIEGITLGLMFLAVGGYSIYRLTIGWKHRRDPSFFERNRPQGDGG
jgi:formate hydrogenlyase subunit 3/multisubunit Na+/H+ antiporter MnhD subunit